MLVKGGEGEGSQLMAGDMEIPSEASGASVKKQGANHIGQTGSHWFSS